MAMERLTLAQLAGRVEEIPIPALGGTVLVHGLTRAEMRVLWEKRDEMHTVWDGLEDAEAREADLVDLLLAALGVTEPVLGGTLDEALNQARKMPAGALGLIVARVAWLSGLRGMIVPPGQSEAVPAGPFRSGETDDDRPGPSPGASDTP